MGTNTSSRHRTAAAFIAGVSMAVVGAFAVQTFIVGAAGDESGDSYLVAMTPCRLADTRPTESIGPNTTLGTNDTKLFQATGTNGQCEIPDWAAGLSLNVTAVNATMSTHVTIWPDGARPNASSLNPEPGQVAVNAVTTMLSTDGSFLAYNLQGDVDVIIDVNGYYDPAPPAAFTVSGYDEGNPYIQIPEYPPAELVSATMTAPADGSVTVTADAHLFEMDGSEYSAECSITDAASKVDMGHAMFLDVPGSHLAGVRTFEVVQGQTLTFRLNCMAWATSGPGLGLLARNAHLSAIFTSAW